MQRGPARPIVARVLGGLLLCSAPAHAQETATSSKSFENKWLEWSAPSECPGPEQIEKRLLDWVKAPLKPEQELKVVASAQSQNGLWLVSVDFSYGADQGKRQVSLKSCSEGADFVALTVALAVDPELHLEDQPTGDPAAVTGSSVVASTDPQSVSEPAEPPTSTESDPAAEKQQDQLDAEESEFAVDHAALAPADRRETERTPRAPSKTTSAVTPGDEEQAQRPEFHFLFGAGLLGVSGSLPAFAPGPVLSGGLQSGPLLLEVSGFYLPGGTYSFDNWLGQGRFQQAGADLRACFHFKEGSLGGGPCAGLQAGAVMAREELTTGAGAPNKGSAFLLSALLGASSQYAFTRSFAGSLGVYAQIPMVKPRFELSEGTLVFQSFTGIVLDLGLRTFF